jgi:aspartyl-tRNA(Asn)/glutamyl-tRNA(Gln) amidotransferase subunit C
MTHVSTDDVQSLAHLSNLQLSLEEIQHLEEDITNILRYVEQLDELATDNVEPTYQVTGLENVWREDEVLPENITREQLLALAPAEQDHQIKVPKVL